MKKNLLILLPVLILLSTAFIVLVTTKRQRIADFQEINNHKVGEANLGPNRLLFIDSNNSLNSYDINHKTNQTINLVLKSRLVISPEGTYIASFDADSGITNIYNVQTGQTTVANLKTMADISWVNNDAFVYLEPIISAGTSDTDFSLPASNIIKFYITGRKEIIAANIYATNIYALSSEVIISAALYDPAIPAAISLYKNGQRVKQIETPLFNSKRVGNYLAFNKTPARQSQLLLLNSEGEITQTNISTRLELVDELDENTLLIINKQEKLQLATFSIKDNSTKHIVDLPIQTLDYYKMLYDNGTNVVLGTAEGMYILNLTKPIKP